jgi:hypothetical protein
MSFVFAVSLSFRHLRLTLLRYLNFRRRQEVTKLKEELSHAKSAACASAERAAKAQSRGDKYKMQAREMERGSNLATGSAAITPSQQHQVHGMELENSVAATEQLRRSKRSRCGSVEPSVSEAPGNRTAAPVGSTARAAFTPIQGNTMNTSAGSAKGGKKSHRKRCGSGQDLGLEMVGTPDRFRDGVSLLVCVVSFPSSLLPSFRQPACPLACFC